MESVVKEAFGFVSRFPTCQYELDNSALEISVEYYVDRWITMGIDDGGVVRVVVHTLKQVDEGGCAIRIISAREATSRELRQYQEGSR